MTERECEELLLQHDVKPTANRIVVVRALCEAGRPLSLAELERRIVTIDKSGVFRALTLFRSHHLVYVLDGGSEGSRYELCHSHASDHDDDVHAHFYCEQCRQTFCLSDCPVPQIALPVGYEALSVSYVVKGRCPRCGGNATALRS